MSATTAAAAPPAPEKPKCLRANASLGIACVGLVVAIVFGSISKVAGDDVGAAGQLIGGIVFLTLGILSFFQRSIEAQVIRLSEENDRYSQENDELKETRTRLDQENKEYDAENKKLRATRTRLDEENREFDESNRALTEQVRNLNQLHNNSVKMIRQLALYGDECKNFGRELGDIKDGLAETDDSLGLTAEELKKQVDALSAVARAIGRE